MLKSLSNYYEIGEKITNDLIKKLIKLRHANDALRYLGGLHYSIFNIAVYTLKSYKEAKSIKILELFNKLGIQILGLNSLEVLGFSR